MGRKTELVLSGRRQQNDFYLQPKNVSLGEWNKSSIIFRTKPNCSVWRYWTFNKL